MQVKRNMEIITRNYHSFLRMAQSQPMLSVEDEQCYFQKYQEDNDKHAYQMIIYTHLRLVAKIVREYKHIFHDLLELAQQGTIGLLKAATKYTYKNAVARFSTYAEPWVRGEITSFLSHFLPEQINTIALNEDDFYYIDDRAGKDIDNIESKQYIQKSLLCLNNREREIIVNRYLNDPPLLRDEIADNMQISSERVRQIENKALIKLKQYLDSNKTSIMIEEIKKS